MKILKKFATSTDVLRNKKSEKVTYSFVFIPVIRISNFKIKNKYKVENFSEVYRRYKITP